MAARRRYSDQERADALALLAANGGNVYETSAKLGIPQQSIRNWVRGDRHPEASQMGEKKKAELDAVFEDAAYKLLGVVRRNMAKLSADRAMVAAGIAVDKMRLLREQATSISQAAGLTDEQRLGRLVGHLRTLVVRRPPVLADGTAPGITLGDGPTAGAAVDPIPGTANGSLPQSGG